MLAAAFKFAPVTDSNIIAATIAVVDFFMVVVYFMVAVRHGDAGRFSWKTRMELKNKPSTHTNVGRTINTAKQLFDKITVSVKIFPARQLRALRQNSRDPPRGRRGAVSAAGDKACVPELFPPAFYGRVLNSFHPLPGQNGNMSDVIQNMSDIIQNMSDIFLPRSEARAVTGKTVFGIPCLRLTVPPAGSVVSPAWPGVWKARRRNAPRAIFSTGAHFKAERFCTFAATSG